MYFNCSLFCLPFIFFRSFPFLPSAKLIKTFSPSCPCEVTHCGLKYIYSNSFLIELYLGKIMSTAGSRNHIEKHRRVDVILLAHHRSWRWTCHQGPGSGPHP